MSFLRITIVLVAVACCGARIVWAEPHTKRQQPDDFSAAADQMFEQFFGETPAERRALAKVEISKRDERQVGDAGLEQLLDSLKQQKSRVRERGKDADYLEALVSEIRPLMQNADRYPTIRIYVADSQETDARAFPGGSIVVTTAMLDYAQTEAALVGILAHELSHIDRGHQLRMARGMKLAQDASPQDHATHYGMPQNFLLMTKQFARPFHAEDEAEADLDGATWAYRLGYDPLEMARLFRRFDQRQPADPLRMPNFLRTHPYHADRYAAIKEFAEQQQAAEPGKKLYIGRKNLRARIPRSVKQFAD